LFTPKAAQRVDRFDPPIRAKLTDRFIAVDYQLLQQALLPIATTDASEAPSPTTEALAQEVEALRKQLESVQKQHDSQTTTQDSPERKTTPPSTPQQTAP
jgi:polyhydroxyalkanoate synthesis regulator protein